MSTRVLVIRAGQLGDTVFASSIIEPLRRLYGQDVQVDWIAKAGMHTLFAADPRIHRVFPIQSRKAPVWLNRTKLAVIARSLRQPYELVVNLELGTMFNGLMRAVRARHKVGMPYRHFTEPAETHAVENLHLIYASFMDADSLSLAVPSLQGLIPAEIRQRFGLPVDYLVLAPSNSHHDKSGGINHRAWPIAHWRTLLAQLAQQPTHVVLIGRADESAYLEELMPLPDNVISLVGRTDLATLIRLIQGARAVITTDTGPSHIAAAVGTPVYAIIGPTNYRRTGPYATPNNTIHILSAELPCSPCYHTPQLKACTFNRCMHGVTPEYVLEALKAEAIH